MEKAPQLSRGFRVHQINCTICEHRQRSGDHCRHAAALTAAILRNDEGTLRPGTLRTQRHPHFNFLALVQQLKQICNHPSQLTGSRNYEAYKSGKWGLFKEILAECLEDNIKVVVFSQYTTMLDIISRYLDDMDIKYTELRGSTTIAKRRKSIKAFNQGKDIKVFCASLLAGGTGIDLTGAQAVIHYDRWWNSAREEQATARVHRFGQSRAVQVFKFITTGTVEEKIHRLINKKQDLAADAVRYDDGSIIKKLDRDEIASILQWTPASG